MQHVFTDDNITEYRLDSYFHREGGPAIIHKDGFEAWYRYGKLHRLDGPALKYANGDKYWYRNGKKHRIDGPAVECANGDKEWWVDGKKYNDPDAISKNNELCEKKFTGSDASLKKMTFDAISCNILEGILFDAISCNILEEILFDAINNL